ncbi:MAG: hypothetical protein K0S11_1471, partial [Gammaproteobacteria bacterium]|nr:hypothetical protein [Gammaproteobacteria bacterium]
MMAKQNVQTVQDEIMQKTEQLPQKQETAAQSDILIIDENNLSDALTKFAALLEKTQAHQTIIYKNNGLQIIDFQPDAEGEPHPDSTRAFNILLALIEQANKRSLTEPGLDSYIFAFPWGGSKKAEPEFSAYQKIAAQSILSKLRQIANHPVKAQLELNLLAQKMTQLRGNLKSLFNGVEAVGADDEVPLLVKLFSVHWQTNDKKLADLLLSDDFLSQYIDKLPHELQYSFTQISSVLLQIKNDQHIQLLESMNGLLIALDDTNKIIYQNGVFKIKQAGKGIGPKGTSPESIAAFNQITAAIEEALKTGITYIKDRPVIELLDTY